MKKHILYLFAVISISVFMASCKPSWDKILDNYDEVVTEYVATCKKAMAGDKTAMNSYMKLATKAEKLAKKIEAADEKEITTEQLVRYGQISMKFLSIQMDSYQNLDSHMKLVTEDEKLAKYIDDDDE